MIDFFLFFANFLFFVPFIFLFVHVIFLMLVFTACPVFFFFRYNKQNVAM